MSQLSSLVLRRDIPGAGNEPEGGFARKPNRKWMVFLGVIPFLIPWSHQQLIKASFARRHRLSVQQRRVVLGRERRAPHRFLVRDPPDGSIQKGCQTPPNDEFSTPHLGVTEFAMRVLLTIYVDVDAWMFNPLLE